MVAVHQEVVVVGDAAVAVEVLVVVAEEAGVVPRVALTSSSNPIAILVSSLPKARSIFLSPRISYQEKLSMARRGSQ